VLVDGDCDDSNSNINPSVSEICNGVDDDCANGVDDGLTFQDYFLDSDGDGFGTGAPVNACQSPGAGYVLVDGDCDDSNSNINPSVSELCNGVDDDCDGQVDDNVVFQDYFLDSDGDGFGAGAPVNACQSPGAGYVLVDGDCDDSNSNINPSASETCNGVDDNCDGVFDTSDLSVTTGNDIAFCIGQNAQLSASATGGDGNYVYEWSPSIDLDDPSIAAPLASPSISTLYTVTVTDGFGCMASDEQLVTVNLLPTATIAGTSAICAGETATLTAAGGISFLWSTTESTAVIDVSPVADAIFSVTVTDANGCTDDESFGLMVNPLPTADAGLDAVYCANTDGAALNASASSGAGPLSFNWSPGNWVNDANIATPLVSPPLDTFFFLTVTDANGCKGMDTVAVSLQDAPLVSISSTSPVCANEDLELGENGGEAVSWAWSGPNGFLAAGQNPVIANADVLAGDYSLVVADANGCRDTAIFSVSLTGGVAFVANFLTSNVACEGDTVHFIEISQTTDLPDAFLWDFGDGAMSTDRDPAHVYTDAGTYPVSVVVSEAGCENFSIEKEITVNNCRANGGEDGFYFYQISPTVNSGRFRLEADLVARGLLRVEVVDINGRVWWSESRQDIAHLDEILSLSEPGVYFVHLRSLQGQKVMKVMVVRA
jgi:hypothetical protein